ncbi:metabotropic glutamate receptor 5-like isoform X2 [Anthonomus grandis grandis]|uniref:metabotropic glutamate receptor 5-like isoform X2 n=1 Tax=Anthonomus grandis grandis TaxID=2921223 RepID=UPI0021653E4A|nr:metabotropic glutamate receptor 5-like isoform X2 [Anthonomus grandis grandis]
MLQFTSVWMVLLLDVVNIIFGDPSGFEGNERTYAYVGGDFIIGALYPLHYPPRKNHISSLGIKCGEIREQYGIQRVEVTLQTLDDINKDPSILPNVTLGLEIRDECWYAPVALQQSIELIRDSITPVSKAKTCPAATGYDFNDQNGQIKDENRGQLIGVIGPGSSSVAMQVQNLLQLFQIPQISYSATSKDLSDKTRFNYFLRVVPSDYYQAQVMLDIVKHFGWTYVSVVNTDENYGQSGIQAFRELAEKADVCIAKENSVLSQAADAVFDNVILNLKQDPKAVVVVCFCEGKTITGLLNATKRLDMTNYFLFIGSDGWADRDEITNTLEEQAWGGISIRIHSPLVKPFDEYYSSLKPETNTRNPWFREFWEKKFKCKLKGEDSSLSAESTESWGESVYSSSTDFSSDYYYDNYVTEMEGLSNVTAAVTNEIIGNFCTGNETLINNYKQDPKLSFVVKAIKSFAYALHHMLMDMCGTYGGVCENIPYRFNGTLLRNYLMNVSFKYDGEQFRYNENGDPPGRYDIMNFQRLENGSFVYVEVGSWNNHSLTWTKEPQFPEIRSKKNVRNISVCAEQCARGHYKSVQQGGKDKKCCWACVPCQAGEILDISGAKCRRCPDGSAPDINKTDCQKLPIKFVQWHDHAAIVAIVFSSLGLLTSSAALIIFHKYHDTPVVKSSTKELCYIILVGMTLAHLSIFAMIAEPSGYSCSVTRFLPGVAFAMVYSALLTKTNRIARILAGNKKRFPNRKMLFMSTTAQVLIVMFLISIEIIISGAMLFIQKPDVTYFYLPNKTLLECDISPEAIIVPLSFDFFLILLCTVYAVKTRNVPENFNEAKFIGFAMYTTCVIWIAFVPIYYGSAAKAITMCMCVTLSALVTWVFLFVPKLYIILFKPEKNNRVFFTTTKIRCHIGSKVASAFLQKTSTNSWRGSSTTTNFNSEHDRPIKEVVKRSLSCQTGLDLLEILLNPNRLVMDLSPQEDSMAVRIVEKDCGCSDVNCQMKHITITLPDNPRNNS